MHKWRKIFALSLLFSVLLLTIWGYVTNRSISGTATPFIPFNVTIDITPQIPPDGRLGPDNMKLPKPDATTLNMDPRKEVVRLNLKLFCLSQNKAKTYTGCESAIDSMLPTLDLNVVIECMNSYPDWLTDQEQSSKYGVCLENAGVGFPNP
jgi:hypothetical protein